MLSLVFFLQSQYHKFIVRKPWGRNSNAQLTHFLDISIASTCEVETQIYLSFDLEYINEADMNRLTQETSKIRRMTISFQKRNR